MAKTQPTGEQLRFRSASTGEHILDTYLEAAEKGGRTLSDLLDDLFDPSTGEFASDVFQFRVDEREAGGMLQYRVGQYVDPNAGWQDIGTLLSESNAVAAQEAAIAARDAAQSAQQAAEDASASAQASSASASTSATSASTSLSQFRAAFIGNFADDAAATASGFTLGDGVFYFKTTAPKGIRLYSDGAWGAGVIDVADFTRSISEGKVAYFAAS